MKEYKIQDIIEIINNKRKIVILQYGEFPNTIEIGKKLLIFIKMHFLAMMNRPLEDTKTIFGMNIIVNDYIEIPDEIKIYYKEVNNGYN